MRLGLDRVGRDEQPAGDLSEGEVGGEEVEDAHLGVGQRHRSRRHCRDRCVDLAARRVDPLREHRCVRRGAGLALSFLQAHPGVRDVADPNHRAREGHARLGAVPGHELAERPEPACGRASVVSRRLEPSPARSHEGRHGEHQGGCGIGVEPVVRDRPHRLRRLDGRSLGVIHLGGEQRELSQAERVHAGRDYGRDPRALAEAGLRGVAVANELGRQAFDQAEHRSPRALRGCIAAGAGGGCPEPSRGCAVHHRLEYGEFRLGLRGAVRRRNLGEAASSRRREAPRAGQIAACQVTQARGNGELRVAFDRDRVEALQ